MYGPEDCFSFLSALYVKKEPLNPSHHADKVDTPWYSLKQECPSEIPDQDIQIVI